MTSFFLVDRFHTLEEDLVLDLQRYDDIESDEFSDLQQHVDELFPDGVTFHGERYLLRGEIASSATNPALELLFEYVRRSHFPHRPSRYQSVFGCPSLAMAQKFRDRFGAPEDPIWIVEANDSFKADMNLLTRDGTTLMLSRRSHHYWSGGRGAIEPLWEVLAQPPARVVEQVE